MEAWGYTIISILIVSIVSLVGVIFLSLQKNLMDKIVAFMISFAAGSLLGDVFIHLLPELVEDQGFTLSVSLTILLGIIIFFVLEKVIHWQHCHIPASEEHVHPFALMNLVGDVLHNFIDGLIIAGSFLASIPLGITTTVAVLLHEIPQEMADFSVLIRGGFTKAKAIAYNFLTALAALIGGIVVLLFGTTGNFVHYIIPFTAGGFLYIAAADLIPELHKETIPWKSVVQVLGFVLGIVIMILLGFLE